MNENILGKADSAELQVAEEGITAPGVYIEEKETNIIAPPPIYEVGQLEFGTSPEIYLVMKVLNRETGEVSTQEVTNEEYLMLRAREFDPEHNMPALLGSLIRVVLSDGALQNIPQTIQVIVDRVHSAVFNPATTVPIQINLINRTLRAFLGGMPFETMAARITLQDVIIEPGQWALIFRKFIVPCLIQYENYLNTPLERQTDVDQAASAESVSTIECENISPAEDTPQES